MKRRHFLLLASGMLAISIGGCSWINGPTMRSQSPDEPEPKEPHTRLVGDLAVPTNMHSVRINAVGLVTGLHGTGSDPAPSPRRDALLEEMKKRNVVNPNTVLASGDVSLVVVQGSLRPGMQKGDRFDVEVHVPSQSETTSLRGGYLLETRLAETAALPNEHGQDRLHYGNVLALAQGPVMIDPTADPKKDHILVCRGRVLSGAMFTAQKSRPLGLVITPEHQNVISSSRVATAVNKRFPMFQNGIKVGVAKARDDKYVELQVHPRYKDNITRYMQVVRAVPLSESAPDRMQRIAALQRKLLEPATAADAAVQLEAIGSDSVDTLLKGTESKDPEVRFCAAESLAYLDRREAAEPLGQIARDQPAFRVFALTALSTMQDFAAYEQLRGLLASPSAETRYGAFRALWAMNEKDAFVRGETLGGQFKYHVLDVAGPPMIHVTRSRLSEIVVFGPGQQLLTPLALSAGNEIMVTGAEGGEIAVSKHSVQDGDQKRTVSGRVDDVIRAIVELGGTYPDVVQAMQEAKNTGALPSRFEIDALPDGGRTYDRIAKDSSSDEEPSNAADQENREVKSGPHRPMPDLFAHKGDQDSKIDGSAGVKPAGQADGADDDEKSNTKKGFFARMLGR